MNRSLIADHLLLWGGTFLLVSILILWYSSLNDCSNKEYVKLLKKQSILFFRIASILIIITVYFVFVHRDHLNNIIYLYTSVFIITLSLLFYRIIDLSIKVLVIVLLTENIFLFIFGISMQFLICVLIILSILVNVSKEIYFKLRK